MKYIKMKIYGQCHSTQDAVGIIRPMCLYDDLRKEITPKTNTVSTPFFKRLYPPVLDRLWENTDNVSLFMDKVFSFKHRPHYTTHPRKTICMTHRMDKCVKCEFIETSIPSQLALKILGDRYKHAHFVSNMQRGLRDAHPITPLSAM